MTPVLPSISATPRVIECPTSFILPQSDTSSPVAAFGNDVHGFMVRVSQAGFDAALAEVPADAPHFKLVEAIPRELVPRGGQVELALAYNVLTGRSRVLGQNLGRRYGRLGRAEIPGAADWSARREREGMIVDWKAGHRWLGPASLYWQTRVLAVAFAYSFDPPLTLVRVALVYLREDGQPVVSRAEFDALALASFADRLRRLRLDMLALRRRFGAGEILPTKQGPWCTYCPAFDHCPAKQRLVQLLRDGTLENRGGQVDALSDEEAGVLWVELADQYVPLLARIHARLEERARRKPFPTPRNTIVCEAAGDPREVIDGKIALRVLTDRYGPALAEAACVVETTKKAVGEAARVFARTNDLPIGKEIAGAIQVLRDQGAITERPGKVAVREVSVQ